MNEIKESSFKTFSSDSNLTEHINSLPSPRQNKATRLKPSLGIILEDGVDENVLNSSNCIKVPFPDKLRNENNLAKIDHHLNKQDFTFARKSKDHGIEFRYIESKRCENEASDSSSENSTINENDHENVQTRIENYNLSPRIRLGNDLFSQNHAQPGNNNQQDSSLNRERNANPMSNVPNQNNLGDFINISQRIDREVNLVLRSHYEFYLFAIVTYAILYLINKDEISCFAEIIAIWIYIINQILRVYKTPFRQEMFSAHKKRKLFVIADWISIALYTVGFTLKVGITPQKQLPILVTPFCSPGILNVLMYIVTKTPRGNYSRKKIFVVLKRIIFWAQILLISLKLDDVLRADWNLTLMIAKITLGGLIIHSVFLLFVFISIIFMVVRRSRLIGSLPEKIQIIGFGWSFLVSLFNTFWLIILFGIDQLLSNYPDSELLQNGLISATTHLIILVFSSILFKPYLKSFLRHFLLQDFYVQTRARERRVEQNIRFEIIEPNPSYFLTISSTFQQILPEELKTYGIQEIREWKKLINKAKTSKYSKKVGRLRSKKFSNDPEKPLRGKEEHNSSVELAISHYNKFENVEENSIKHIYYTNDDLDIYGTVTRPIKHESIKENENLCYICVQKVPSAIIMKCGHSGICYECAIESWKKDDKCMMCRRKIENILKVKFYENFNISKSIHGTKKVVEVVGEN